MVTWSSRCQWGEGYAAVTRRGRPDGQQGERASQQGTADPAGRGGMDMRAPRFG
jgi:hypothetical protein